MPSEPLRNAISQWAAATPKVRRVWLLGGSCVALELQPVADSEETFAVWMANCGKWQAQLVEQTGQRVELEWLDPDGGVAPSDEPDTAKVLVYERFDSLQ